MYLNLVTKFNIQTEYTFCTVIISHILCFDQLVDRFVRVNDQFDRVTVKSNEDLYLRKLYEFQYIRNYKTNCNTTVD